MENKCLLNEVNCCKQFGNNSSLSNTSFPPELIYSIAGSPNSFRSCASPLQRSSTSLKTSFSERSFNSASNSDGEPKQAKPALRKLAPDNTMPCSNTTTFK